MKPIFGVELFPSNLKDGLASVISVQSIIRVTRERNFEDIREKALGHAHTLHLGSISPTFYAQLLST